MPRRRQIVPSPSDPAEVAKHLIETSYTSRDGDERIVRWRGDIYIREKSVWSLRDGDGVRSGLYKWLSECVYMNGDKKPVPWRPNTTRVNQVVDALGSLVFLDERASPPCWLRNGFPGSALMPLQNGLLNPDTRELQPHSSDHFHVTVAPFRYDPSARAGAWEKYLKLLWPDDPDSILCLQEIFGYLMSGRLDMEKLFLMIGPKRSGRGTIMTVATALIGREYVVGPTLGSLGRPFGLEPLIGKSLAVVGDARIEGPATRSAAEALLGISGRDVFTIDRKYKRAWTGLLPTRVVILSNEVPPLSDASGTIESRFEILRLTKSWLGKEDPKLKNKFAQPRYLPGLLNWALDGYDRLYQQGHFTKPESASDTRETMLNLATPYPRFAEECCVFDAQSAADKDMVYMAWKDWCDINGVKPGSKEWFSRGMLAAFPQVRLGRESSGARRRVFQGVGLVEEAMSGAKLSAK